MPKPYPERCRKRSSLAAPGLVPVPVPRTLSSLQRTVGGCSEEQVRKSVLRRATRPVETRRGEFLHFSRHDHPSPKFKHILRFAANLCAPYPARSYPVPLRDALVLSRDTFRLRRCDQREGQFYDHNRERNKHNESVSGGAGCAQREPRDRRFWECLGWLKLQSKPHDHE